MWKHEGKEDGEMETVFRRDRKGENNPKNVPGTVKTTELAGTSRTAAVTGNHMTAQTRLVHFRRTDDGRKGEDDLFPIFTFLILASSLCSGAKKRGDHLCPLSFIPPYLERCNS